jgi:hypothetical protein
MKPSRFIGYAERKLGCPLSDEEREAVLRARVDSSGKREGVKAMRGCTRAGVKSPALTKLCQCETPKVSAKQMLQSPRLGEIIGGGGLPCSSRPFKLNLIAWLRGRAC